MVQRREIHDLIDKQLDDWKYGENIPIQYGRVIFELQVENGEVTMVTKEREKTILKQRRKP
jgi:hypothetical protein